MFVRVRHPDIEGEPLVPKSALSQMDPRWEVVEETTPVEEPEPPTAEAEEAPRPSRKKKEG